MSKTIVTHSGMFHADDIFAVATVLLVYPDSTVIRTRDRDTIEGADIVVDVGMEYDPGRMRFDHHQPGGADMRSNSIPYASFGLVWKEFGEKLAGPEAKEIVETKLVMPIDAPDNGISTYKPVFDGVMPYTVTDFLYSYLTREEEGEDYLYRVFMEAVEISKGIITREIIKAKEKVEGMKEVRRILEETEDKRIIVIDRPLPWEPVLGPVPETMFVVYPRREGNWGVKGVPAILNGFERKKYLPSIWGGKEGEEFQKITGVADAVFCHRGCWLAAADSKEGALELAQKALNA